jgi:hypothetical protein
LDPLISNSYFVHIAVISAVKLLHTIANVRLVEAAPWQPEHLSLSGLVKVF